MQIYRQFIAIAVLAALAAAPQARDRVTDSDVVLLKRVTPPFPLEAFSACISGYALAAFTIDTAGDVTDVEIIESRPDGVFDAVTIAALSQWKFSPRLVNGEVVPTRVSQHIDFAIRSDCEVGAELPADLDTGPGFDEQGSRAQCRLRGGREFGFAELNFRVDGEGRPADVTVVRHSGADYVRRAREALAERSFDPDYEALTFSHTFAFCLTGG